MPKAKNKNMTSKLKIECDQNGVGAPAPPLSPLSNLYLKFLSPMSEEVMHCAMTFRDPIDVEALKKDVSNSLLVKHPRFCSLLIRDHTGEHWITTRVNVDDHIIVHHTTTASQLEDHDEDDEGGINSFLARIVVSTPLSENKPLWEMHVLLGLKCVVLRIHHALGDGVSFMSLLFGCFGKKTDDNNSFVDNSKMKNNHNAKNTISKGDKGRKKGVGWLFMSIWFTLVNLMRLLGRILWVKDKKSVISGCDGVELWPRKLVTAKFLLEDFKSMKTVIPQVEISDLMSTNSNRKNGWGNKTSLMLLPIRCCNDLHPLDHVREMKATMDRKKQYSLEAYFLYIISIFLANFFSLKALSLCFKRIMANTTLCISNVGRLEEIEIAGNLVTHMRPGVSTVPQAITIHMLSYAGKAYLQVMVAKDIVADPELLVNFFQQSFFEIKSSINKNV